MFSPPLSCVDDFAIPDIVVFPRVRGRRTRGGRSGFRVFLLLGADARFHLFALGLLCVLGGAGLAALAPAWLRPRLWPLAFALALLPFVLPRGADPEPQRRIVAETLAQVTPDHAVIVTGIEEPYLEPLLLRGTRRRVIAATREVEYASKAIARRRIADPFPPPRGPADHRCDGLFLGGAADVVGATAEEDPGQLVVFLSQGFPVFLDSSYARRLPLGKLMEMGVTAEGVPGQPWLLRLRTVP